MLETVNKFTDVFISFHHFTDHHIVWFIEDSSFAAFGTSCKKVRLLFRVWSSSFMSFDAGVCIDSSLAGLHLVCHW